MTDEELVDAYGTACLRAGRSDSNSGLVVSASDDWQEMRRLGEALKRRLRELARVENQASVAAREGRG